MNTITIYKNDGGTDAISFFLSQIMREGEEAGNLLSNQYPGRSRKKCDYCNLAHVSITESHEFQFGSAMTPKYATSQNLSGSCLYFSRSISRGINIIPIAKNSTTSASSVVYTCSTIHLLYWKENTYIITTQYVQEVHSCTRL